MSNKIVPIFEGHEVRMVELNGQPAWVAMDVCKVLGLTNVTETLKNIPEDWKGILSLTEGGRDYDSPIITEPGLYQVIFRSRKPIAERFRRWVFEEVLPSIRKTGGYTLPQPVPVPPMTTGNIRLDTARFIADEIASTLSKLDLGPSTPQLVAGCRLSALGQMLPEAKDALMEGHKLLAATTTTPEVWLTPTSLGERLGTSAKRVNLLLTGLGFQLKNSSNRKGEPAYIATELGKEYSSNTTASGVMGDVTVYQHLKWSEKIIPILAQEVRELIN
jgi:hypothetical protein